MISTQKKLQNSFGQGVTDFLPFCPSGDNGFRPAFADVLFTVDEDREEVWAHSFVLTSRCHYFRKLFDKAPQQHHRLSLPVSRAALVQVLRFLYTDLVQFETEDMQLLRQLAFLAKTWKISCLDFLFVKICKQSPPSAVLFSTLWQDFGHALLQVPHDVILSVEGKKFPLHRFVLCTQSDFFRVLLSGNFSESNVSSDSAIEIGNVSAADFEKIVRFLYTRSLDFLKEAFSHSSSDSVSDVMHVIELSMYFQIPSLRKSMEHYFLPSSSDGNNDDDLSFRNVSITFEIAKAAQWKGLRRRCAQFVCQSFDVIPLDIFLGYSKDLLEQVLNEGALECDESIIFDRIIRWGYKVLGREDPKRTDNIRIPDDPELMRAVESLLPPTSIFSKRNKRSLMGFDVFSINELI